MGIIRVCHNMAKNMAWNMTWNHKAIWLSGLLFACYFRDQRIWEENDNVRELRFNLHYFYKKLPILPNRPIGFYEYVHYY